MFKRRFIALCALSAAYVFCITGCDPFSSRDVPEDISGTWGGSITEGAGYYNITLRLSQSGMNVSGSWTSSLRGVNETGRLNARYFDGKAAFTLSKSSAIIGNMNLRFEDNKATGTGTERGNEFTIAIQEL